MSAEAFAIDPTSLKSIKSKTILITGASSGIGLSTALLLSSLHNTNNIAILDLSPPPQSLTNLLSPHRLHFHPCDIRDWKQQRAGFKACAKKFGRIDVVFVNAGIAEHKDQIFTDEDDDSGELREPDRRTEEICLNAATDSVKLAVHWLRKNKAGRDGIDGGGSIVMTASLAGYLGSAGAPLYSAAKHGIVGLLRSLKQETAKLNISISLIAPGITLTPILSQNRDEELSTSSSSSSLDKWALEMREQGVPINTPETIALAVGFLISKGMLANGMGLLIQNDRVWDVEAGVARSRNAWMGKEMLALFKGGRSAPLFKRVEGEKAKI